MAKLPRISLTPGRTRRQALIAGETGRHVPQQQIGPASLLIGFGLRLALA
jgi:hypothetical protein